MNNRLQLPDQYSLLVNEQFETAPLLSSLPPYSFCPVLLNFTLPFSAAFLFFRDFQISNKYKSVEQVNQNHEGGKQLQTVALTPSALSTFLMSMSYHS